MEIKKHDFYSQKKLSLNYDFQSNVHFERKQYKTLLDANIIRNVIANINVYLNVSSFEVLVIENRIIFKCEYQLFYGQWLCYGEIFQ